MSSGMRTGPWRLRIPPETAISVGISRGFTAQQNNQMQRTGNGSNGAPPLIWVFDDQHGRGDMSSSRSRITGQPPGGPGTEPAAASRRTFAERTGQGGRLKAARAIMALAGFMYLVAWSGYVRPHAVKLIALATLVGLGGLVGECLAVRCPSCGAAVVWHIYKTRRASEADATALSHSVCPRCGYDPP